MSLMPLLPSFHGAPALRVFLLALFLSVPVAQAKVFNFLYTHYANREPLAAALTDFARTGGYRAEVSSELSGTVSGRFEKLAPVDFLRGMERAFGVRWYRLGETIHFHHASEFRRALLPAPTQGAKKLAAQLENSGLVSRQLPLGIPPDAAGFLTVSGPEDYVRALENLAAMIERAGDARVMRVFRLKYASADDLAIESMGRSVTVPGVATLLRAMVLGEYAPSSGGAAAGVAVKAEKATVEKLKGSGLTARGSNAALPAPAATASAAVGISIVADPRVNAVVVQDAQSRMAYYEQVIADLDKETHLIEIHAAIVDIDSDHTSELGLRFGGRHARDSGWSAGGEFSTATGGGGQNGSFALTPDASGSFAEAGGILSTIYTHGNNFFVARVQALEKNGNARMLGRPSVLTTDNLEATLENITTYYVSVRGQEEVDLFKVEAGTVLRVTPHIIENTRGEASIKLAVTVQDDQENSGGMSGDMAIPPIKQTKINTQAIVDAGQSLLIGGYYFEEKRAGEDGVPGLMHIPLIGRLFKTTTENTRQMERLVLITPRILRPGEASAPLPQIDGADFRRAPGQDHYAPRLDERAVREDATTP
jgi:type III secretion protein C